MTKLDLYPKTKAVPAGTLRAGQVVVESHGYPAVETCVAFKAQSDRYLTVYCRYVWQGAQELSWALTDRVIESSTLVDRAI